MFWKPFKSLIPLFFMFFIISSCSTEFNSILTSDSGCQSVTGCSQNQTNPISTNGLLITPDEPIITSSTVDSDLVEISGSCRDLGRRNNRILVQVFEGESEALFPIIDNSIDTTCQENISTSSLRPSGGVGKKCFIVSQGLGLTEDNLQTPQYPQCFNGRFSFKVRLGRVIRQDVFSNSQDETTNPRANYLVNLRLRTLDGITSDSAPASVVIRRLVGATPFTITQDQSKFRCEIKFDAPAFTDTRYSLQVRWEGPNHAITVTTGPYANNGVVTTSLASSVSAPFPLVTDGTAINNFFHNGQPLLFNGAGLMAGMNYHYTLRTEDFTYSTDYLNLFNPVAFESSGFSNEFTCRMPPPIVSSTYFTTTETCSFSALNINSTSGTIYSTEWRVSTQENWQSIAPDSGVTLVGCTGGNSCNVVSGSVLSSTDVTSGTITRGVPYYFAVRQYVDADASGFVSSGDLVGEWSPTTIGTVSNGPNSGAQQNTSLCFIPGT